MREMMVHLLSAYGYVGVFFLIAVENIFPPIPSEVILTFGGFLTTVTTMHVGGVVLASTMGSVFGAAVLYGVGRWLSAEKLAHIVRGPLGKMLHLHEEDIRTAAEKFAQKGKASVFYCRCIPILRSLISIPAGMCGMDLVPFFVLTTAGSLVWNVLLISLGALAGSSWPVLTQWVAQFSAGMKFFLYAALTILLAWLIIRKRNVKKQDFFEE